jgi:hypothetical protein
MSQSLEGTLLAAAVVFLETNKERLASVSPETLEVVEKLALKHGHRACVEFVVEGRRQQSRVTLATRRKLSMTRAIDLKMAGGDPAAVDAELASVDADDEALAKLDAAAPTKRSAGMTRTSVLGVVE